MKRMKKREKKRREKKSKSVPLIECGKWMQETKIVRKFAQTCIKVNDKGNSAQMILKRRTYIISKTYA